MKKMFILHVLVTLLLCTSASNCFALTPAGTSISNQATLSFRLSDDSIQTSTSGSVSFVVMQLLDVTLTAMDATPVLVNAPDTSRVLTFKINNVGNGTEFFTLSRNDRLAGDDFDPIAPSDATEAIYLENGLEAGFQSSGPNADIRYIAGSNDPKIMADNSQLVYLVSHIPSAQQKNAVGSSLLHVAALNVDSNQHAGSVLGNVVVGDKTIEHILGATHGVAEAIGNYKVSGLVSAFNKSVSKIVDPNGGSMAMEGSVISYQLTYELMGEGTVKNVMLTDPVPNHMSYVSNTLKINGEPATDTMDSDKVSVSNGVVKAQLGDQQPPYKVVVEFDLKVQQ